MKLEGFIPYEKEKAEKYRKCRWWLGMTLGDVLDKMSDVYPDQEAVVGSGVRHTYRDLRNLVDRMAYNLLQQGLQKGDRVLLQLPNLPEFVISYFALQKAGLIAVLLTVNHTPNEIIHLAKLTRPRGWIVPPQYRKSDFLTCIETVRRENPDLKTVVLVGGESSGRFVRYEDLIANDVETKTLQSTLQDSRPDPSDVCQILPSGGTTGLPKGAPRTHEDYLCNVEYKSRAWHINVTDTCLVATTVGHNLALLVCITGPMFHGAKIVLLDSTYPQDFCQAVQDEKVTCAGVVPTLVSRLMAFDRLHEYDFSSFRKMYVGAAYSAPELVQEVEEKLGCLYINAFGMVEGPCSQTRPNSTRATRCETIGRPICPYDEFVTLDGNGIPTPNGVEGELAARGPGIFTGYFNNLQANQSSFTPDGYFRTGDLAVIDTDGYIRITGRIKDIIIRGGENIAAQFVEELISSYPHVEYVSVIGVPHPDLGEEVCAYIQPIPGASLTREEVVQHLREVGASKIHFPARIEFMDKLPLTAAGKADKKALKADLDHRLSAESAGA